MRQELNNLNKLRAVEIDILNKVVAVCEKHNLKYYLAYGTLIGAIRHKGFIPWDDDIDIWMFREDYDKFAEIAQKDLGDKYFYQDRNTDKEYPYHFAKVKANGTELIQSSTRNLKIHNGIYIDIFPLDKAPSEEHLDEYIKQIRELKSKSEWIYGYKERGRFKALCYKMLRKSFYYKSIHNKIEKTMKKFNNTSREYYRYNFGYNKLYITKADFGDGILVDFENTKYIVPSNYDKPLTQVYGDYMKLPPEDKQVSNHDNLNVDFGEYFKEDNLNR